MINIGDLDYDWLLTEASKKLENFVKSFQLYKIGLTNDVWLDVCPEANIELYDCIYRKSFVAVKHFYQECLEFIDEIFENGAVELKMMLGKLFFATILYIFRIFSFRRQIFSRICHNTCGLLATCLRSFSSRC